MRQKSRNTTYYIYLYYDTCECLGANFIKIGKDELIDLLESKILLLQLLLNLKRK